MSSVERFFSAWGDPDGEARLQAMNEAIAPSGTYADPMTPAPLVGPAAAAEYVAAFTENAPGATASVIDAQDRHGVTRATVEFKMADGQAQHGQYFVELDDAGKISRMVGFVGIPTP